MTKQPIFPSIFIKTCIGVDILFLAWAASIYDLDKFLDRDSISHFSSVILILFLMLIAASMIYIPFQIKKNRWKVFLPLASHMITIFLFILLFMPLDLGDYSISPYENIRAKLELQLNQSSYEKTIKMIEESGLTTNGCSSNDLIRLPQNQSNDLLIENSDGIISVFFDLPYLHVSSHSGSIYRSNDTVPPTSLMDCAWINCQREKQNWYYCVNSD